MRDLLRIHKETQEYVGKSIGKSRPTVQQYCDGSSEAPYETLVKIAQHFNVTIDWLLGMPNASKEVNTDKYQVMKTTGLSERAVDQLINASVKHPQAVDSLLSVNDFTTAMSDLDEAIHLSQNWSCDSYYLIPAYTEQPTIDDIVKDIQKRSDGYPTIIQINEIVRHLISYSFEEIESQVKKDILRNIYSIMYEEWNAEKEGAESNGNDNSTEE
jgi:transcriptional regulator with XRE-family HTH domain